MDSTTIVAVAGIGGTLAASVISPMVAGKTQVSARRQGRLLDQKLDVYSELLEATRLTRENLMYWSSIPLADLKEPEMDRLSSTAARLRVVGSDKVVVLADKFAALTNVFFRELMPARQLHQNVREDPGYADKGETIRARLALGEIADEASQVVKELESAIRSEMKV